MEKRRAITLTLFFFLLIGTGSAQTDNSSVVQLSETTEITDYSFDGLNVSVTFDADVPTIVSLVDQNSFETSGAGTPNVKVIRLTAGKTTVNMRLEPGRYNTIFISEGTDGFATISDDREPLLTDVYKRDLPIVGLISVLAGFGQFFGRRWWDRLRLGWGIRWDG